MKRLLVCLALSLAGASPSTAGSDCGGRDNANVHAAADTPKGPTPAAIFACTKIASPAKRLDCYDALTGHSD